MWWKKLKYCKHCDIKYSEKIVFCTNCGRKLANFVENVKESRKINISKNENLVKYIGVGLGLVIIFFWLFSSGGSSTTGQNHNIGVVKQPVYQTVTNVIVKGIVTTNGGSYQYYQFSIPTGVTATVSGNFKASGGFGNDIYLYIFTQNDFINWQNHHQASTYYNSGKLTVGTISTTLSSGTYYLVYDNSFDIFPQKTIQTDVEYSYQMCVQNC